MATRLAKGKLPQEVYETAIVDIFHHDFHDAWRPRTTWDVINGLGERGIADNETIPLLEALIRLAKRGIIEVDYMGNSWKYTMPPDDVACEDCQKAILRENRWRG